VTARGALLLVTLSLGVAGCDPGWNVHGTLVDAKGAPIAGATVAFRCGTRTGPTGPAFTMLSKAAGEFEAGGVASDPGAACSLEIVAGGHPTKTVAITDACYRSTSSKSLGKPCKPGEGTIVVP
jgi:hypothetical protein